MGKLVGRTAFAVAAAAVFTLATAAPAFAHDTRYDGPYACPVLLLQSCGYGQVRDNHQVVDACDTRADGYGYYVQYVLRSGTTGQVTDGNGATSGCGIARVGSASNPVARYAVCSNQGPAIHVCSGYKTA